MKILNSKNLVLITLLANLAVPAWAEIVEINRMHEITPYITSETLVVFDLDNTIMETAQSLGSDQWFDYQVEKFVDEGYSKAEATDRAIEIWAKVQEASQMTPVEKSTPALIENLQLQRKKVIALTARPASLERRTREQLESMDVNIGEILAIGPGQSKGAALADYLNRNGLNPDRIVFVDDKKKHTETVDQSLDQLPVEHFEFRYGAADPRVKSLDPSVVEFQLEYFLENGELISDDVARRLM